MKMDDQRIEEIVSKANAEFLTDDHRRFLGAGFNRIVAAAIREALSAQEEELRSLREERDEAMVRHPLSSEQAKAALRLRATCKERCRALVRRAESAEAELLRRDPSV
jgi:hypothetical protein